MTLEDWITHLTGEIVDPYRQLYQRQDPPDPERQLRHMAPNEGPDGTVLYDRAL